MQISDSFEIPAAQPSHDVKILLTRASPSNPHTGPSLGSMTLSSLIAAKLQWKSLSPLVPARDPIMDPELLRTSNTLGL